LRQWFGDNGFSDGAPAVTGAAYQLASGLVHWL